MRRASFIRLLAFSALNLLCTVPTFGADSLQYLTEERHFYLSTARQFEDQMWVDYKGLLYFQPTTGEAEKIFRAIQKARNGYVALTNIAHRNELRLQTLKASGIPQEYLQRLSAPTDPTNEVPALHGKMLQRLDEYRVLRTFTNGDALIVTTGILPLQYYSKPRMYYDFEKEPERYPTVDEDIVEAIPSDEGESSYVYGAYPPKHFLLSLLRDGSVVCGEAYYIYGLRRAADSKMYSDSLVIQEFSQRYPSSEGTTEVMALSSAELREKDKEVLSRIRDCCRRSALNLEADIEALKREPATPTQPQNLRVVK
jgi:hypothetical protein